MTNISAERIVVPLSENAVPPGEAVLHRADLAGETSSVRMTRPATTFHNVQVRGQISQGAEMQLITRRATINRLPPNVPLAAAIFAAMAVVALRAAARRPQPRLRHPARSAPGPAMAEDRRPQPAVTAGTPRLAGGETAKSPCTGRPGGSVEQMQYVFHELHADYHHALCEVCLEARLTAHRYIALDGPGHASYTEQAARRARIRRGYERSECVQTLELREPCGGAGRPYCRSSDDGFDAARNLEGAAPAVVIDARARAAAPPAGPSATALGLPDLEA
jgi:hypothetical protein